ncbi:MAG: putative Ig domain-containing protein [Opitutales bacterium]|jgi:alpha-galactosidase
MKLIRPKVVLFLAVAALSCSLHGQPLSNTTAAVSPVPTPPPILTPPPAKTPRINGPKIFGVRPGSPFLFSIPATGDRPMQFSVDGLPAGLQLDPNTGRITGQLNQTGEYPVTIHATNALGQASRPFKIVVGDEIGLTPAMGWNNYNLSGPHVDQKIILAAAHAMVDSGLAEHGWTYCNTDDGWQDVRGGDLNAIQPNAGFPDIAGMVKEIHGLGLKAGIYSSPWVTTYDRHIGGSSEDPQGKWSTALAKANNHDHSQKLPFAIGTYHFAVPDAKQFALWGFDYLKYDWAPIHVDATKEMYDALHATGRDFVFSLSNNGLYTLLNEIGNVSPYANSWRITDDVHDKWANISKSAFGNDAWAPYSRPGHFNDLDMLVIGVIGWGHPHPTHLTPDEQYTQVSMWCLLSSPLLLGCDLQKLDPFTLSLVTNDEVLDVDQDSLGKQATCVAQDGDLNVYAKPLEDGSWAVGLLNRGLTTATVTVKWADLKLTGKQVVRDLWRQQDLGVYDQQFSSPVNPHGVVLLRISPAK